MTSTNTGSEPVVDEAGGPPGVPRGRGPAVAVLAVVVLLVGGLVAVMLLAGRPPDGTAGAAARGVPGGALPSGAAAPDFTLTRLDGGGTLSLSQARGQVVVLNFWASWCAPCREEATVLGAADQRWAAQHVLVIGVDSQDKDADAQRFVERYGVDYPVVVDHAGTLMSQYGVAALPETLIIDAAGAVQARWKGQLEAGALDRKLQQVIAASP